MKNDSQRSSTIIKLIIFSLLAIGGGWLGRFIDQMMGLDPSEGLGVLIWLLSPIILSFILRVLYKEGWGDLGIKPDLIRNWRWYLISLLIYPFNIVVILLIGSAMGWISLHDLTPGTFIPVVIAGLIGSILTASEELGWRGYLAPKVHRLKLPSLLEHVIVGLIWGAWHIPYFSVFWGYAMKNLPCFTILFFLGAITHSIVYGEIRILSKSVWPALMMHAAGNAIFNPLIGEGFISFTPGKELLATVGIEGAVGIVIMLLLGIWIHNWRINHQPQA